MLVSYALQNNTVFKSALNWVNVSDGSQTDSGSEFHNVGVQALQLCCNKILQREWVPVLDRKQQNIFGRILLFWSVKLQSHHTQLNGGDHDWLIQTLVCTVQRGMLVQHDAGTFKPRHKLLILFSAEQAANVVDVEHQWRCGRSSMIQAAALSTFRRMLLQ